MVRDGLGCNPMDGSLHLFAGRCRKGLKILYWDRKGFCLWQKRLEEDLFPWPHDEGSVRSINSDQLAMLLDGIDWLSWKKKTRDSPK